MKNQKVNNNPYRGQIIEVRRAANSNLYFDCEALGLHGLSSRVEIERAIDEVLDAQKVARDNRERRAKSDAQAFPQAEEISDPGLEVVKKVFDGARLSIPMSDVVEDPSNPRLSPEVNPDDFRAHMARLIEYYIESWDDDGQKMNGSVEGLAVDFGLFVQSIDGECAEGIDKAMALHQLLVPLLRAMDKAGVRIDSESVERWRRHALGQAENPEQTQKDSKVDALIESMDRSTNLVRGMQVCLCGTPPAHFRKECPIIEGGK